MPKPNKSSATSNTRKKQASKKAGASDGQAKGKQQNEKDPSLKGLTKAQRKALKENRPRVFVPPPRPPVPARPDPLDAQGLARTLPAELVVVLRRLGKKDAITRRKGIDEFKELWVDVIANLHSQGAEDATGELAIKEEALTEALPVWLHHLPSLLLSPAHRSVSLQLHTKLLKIPAIKADLLHTLSLGLLPGQHHGRDVLGTWMTAALEEARRGSIGSGEEALTAWEEFVDWREATSETDINGTVKHLNMSENLEILVDYLRLAILDPQELHRQVHPSPVKAPESPAPLIFGKKGSKDKGSKSQTPRGYFTPPPEAENEEQEEDAITVIERSTRYQISGLLGLSYLLQHAVTETLEHEYFGVLLKHKHLWSLFTTTAKAEDPDCVAAPPVRQTLYDVLLALLTRHESYMRSKLFAVVGPIFLQNIWTETDVSVWSGRAVPDAVVAFFTKFKEIWLIDDEGECLEDESEVQETAGNTADDTEVEESEPESADEAAVASSDEQVSKSTLGQVAYQDFLAYLQRACNGTPLIGYPLVLVIVSTIPESFLPLDRNGLEALCASLWAAYDAKLLPSSTNFSASAFFHLTGTILDCIILLNIRSVREASANAAADSAVNDSDMENAVATQVGRVWSDGVLVEAAKITRMTRMAGAEKNTDFYRMAVNVGSAIARLDKAAPSTADKALENIAQATTLAFSDAYEGDARPSSVSILVPRLQLLLEALEQGHTGDAQRVGVFTDNLSLEIARKAVNYIKCSLFDNGGPDGLATEDYPKMLASLLTTRGQRLMRDLAFAESLSDLLLRQGSSVIAHSDAILFSPVYVHYLNLLPEDAAQKMWQELSRVIAAAAKPAKFAYATALLVTFLGPDIAVQADDTAWGEIAIEAGEDALAPERSTPEAIELVKSVFITQRDVIGKESYDHLIITLSTSLSHQALASEAEALSEEHQSTILSLLEMLRPAICKNPQHLLKSDIHRPIYSKIFWLAFLPLDLQEDLRILAGQIWTRACEQLNDNDRQILASTVRFDLLKAMTDVDTIISPYDLLETLVQQTPENVVIDLEFSLQPEALDMENLLGQSLQVGTEPVSCWILDPLLPYQPESHSGKNLVYDRYGRSAYARALEALIYSVHSDIAMVKGSPGSLFQIVLASRISADALNGIGSYGIYNQDIDRGYLKSIRQETVQLTSYAVRSLAADLPASWHQATMTSLTKGAPQADTLSALLHTLASPERSHTIYQRCLRDLLESILRSADIAVAERWLAFGTSLDSKPYLALAILTAVNRSLERSPRLDRVRNEIANRLTGVAVQTAATEGLRVLRIFNALTPAEDSEDIFLPQQRTVFLMQHLNGWLVSDDEAADDFPEELEARIALLYANLAPIVQDVPGAHWDSMIDMISSNLEVVTFAEEQTFNLMFATLSLLECIQRLALTNKSLRAMWTEKMNQVKAVAQLLLTVQPELRQSSSSTALLDKVIDILDRSDDIAFFDSMERVYPLLKYADLPVQRSLYHILRKSIRTRTASLVVSIESDANVDVHNLPELPRILVELAGEATDGNTSTGNLLAWLLIFEHFVGASNSLRSAYIDQIRNADLVPKSLMNFVPPSLKLAYPSNNPVGSERYKVDQFYVEFIENAHDADLIGLRVHVFYRALETMPTLIRGWYESCKDRQLTMNFITVVTRHFSPILIGNEFAVLKTSGAISELEDDNLSIKIVSGAPEVNARYIIDEQPMEILIRFPAEFSLKSVEVKDLGRVGVTENKWRGWIFNLQQMIMSRNGLILEGLKVFKNNVTLHFEGKTECSICYSIIQMNDRSLPSRTCPTCKNKYHSNCLLQWFKSSSSSSCPMCRGLF